MDVRLDCSLIFFFLGALLCLFAIGLEPSALNEMKENASKFKWLQRVVKCSLAEKIERHLGKECRDRGTVGGR